MLIRHVRREGCRNSLHGIKRNAMYEILLHDRVVKFYDRLDNKNAARINRAIETLLEKPAFGKNIKMLKGELEGKFRLRVGSIESFIE
jgi:mRNA-degrading endonuclease RelE of RelBE toxin-antitoxin system